MTRCSLILTVLPSFSTVCSLSFVHLLIASLTKSMKETPDAIQVDSHVPSWDIWREKHHSPDVHYCPCSCMALTNAGVIDHHIIQLSGLQKGNNQLNQWYLVGDIASRCVRFLFPTDNLHWLWASLHLFFLYPPLWVAKLYNSCLYLEKKSMMQNGQWKTHRYCYMILLDSSARSKVPDLPEQSHSSHTTQSDVSWNWRN